MSVCVFMTDDVDDVLCLIAQVHKWMKEAESVKALLITRDMEKNAQQRTSDSQEQCSVQ